MATECFVREDFASYDNTIQGNMLLALFIMEVCLKIIKFSGQLKEYKIKKVCTE